MSGVRALGIGACPGGDRLDALALAFTQDPHGVDRERRAPRIVAKHSADPIEVIPEPLFGRGVHELRHTQLDHVRMAPAPFWTRNPLSDRIDPAFPKSSSVGPELWQRGASSP